MDASTVVFAVFVLLLFFRLLDSLIPWKILENLLIVPFQLTIFLLPAYFFARYKNPKQPLDYLMHLRIRAPRLYQLPLMATAVALMIFGTILTSVIFAGTDSLSKGFTLYNTFVSQNSGGFFAVIGMILAYAVIPAFCEELVFRGILCREYERINVPCGILVSAVFFALLHFNLGQFLVYLFSGLLLALAMYATGSLLVPMMIHCVFNIFGLFGQSYLNAFYTITGGTTGLFMFLVCLLTLGLSALFCLFASQCYARRAKASQMASRKLFPPADKLTSVLMKMAVTPFALASFFLYIIVVVILFFL